MDMNIVTHSPELQYLANEVLSIGAYKHLVTKLYSVLILKALLSIPDKVFLVQHIDI